MDKITRQANELGETFSLSPEHWLSFSPNNMLSIGVSLAEVVDLHKKGTTKISDSALVMDTGNSDRGLFILPFKTGPNSMKRVSNKKIVPEGAVLISRLRPYLQQVVYVPEGATEILGVSEILCSTEYYVLTSKDKNKSIAFLVPWLLSKGVQSVFDQATTGGHHPRFNDELLLRLFVPDDVMNSREQVSSEVKELILGHLNSQQRMSNLVDRHEN